jgi:hypothetical protein
MNGPRREPGGSGSATDEREKLRGSYPCREGLRNSQTIPATIAIRRITTSHSGPTPTIVVLTARGKRGGVRTFRPQKHNTKLNPAARAGRKKRRTDGARKDRRERLPGLR